TAEELVMPLAATVTTVGAAAKPLAEKPNKTTSKAARKIEISTKIPPGKTTSYIKQNQCESRLENVV
ncbi:MAG TPA: hypothetical protein PK472_10660, partial [Pseudomonadota bacterium]|nr:hypothetical protein [Pseudomonadota bacterium]